MIRYLIIIAVAILVFFLIRNISQKNKKTLQNGKNLPVLLIVAAAVIGLAFLILPRLGVNPFILLQKLVQLMPFIRGVLPF